MHWQLREARRRFGRVVKLALDDGPQVVTRHGRAVVVVVAADEYQKLTGKRRDFWDFLLSGPDLSVLDLQRAKDLARDVEL